MRRIAPPAHEALSDRAPYWVAHGTPEPLRGELLRALGPAGSATRALDLVRYASDASPYRTIPRAVAIPRDVAATRLPSWQAFYGFFGTADDPANVAAYHRLIAPHLDPQSRAYWESRGHDLCAITCPACLAHSGENQALLDYLAARDAAGARKSDN